MTRTVCDVVIIGAGIVGCSAAFHLAKHRHLRVIVVERGALASGMTKRSGALIHSHFTDESLARLAHISIKQFQHWQDIVGASCGWTQTGLLVVADDANANRLENEIAVLGVQKILPADVREHTPQAKVDDVVLASFEPDAGYVDATLAAQTLAARAKELGVTFKTGTLVKNIRVNLGRVAGVDTNTGDIETPAVVLAAGVWTDRLLKPLGMQIGIQPTRAEVAFFDRPTELKAAHPAFLDYATGAYFRPHTYGLTMAGQFTPDIVAANPDSFDENIAGETVNGLRQRIAVRLPGMAQARFVRGHAGLNDATQSGRAVISPAPGIAGLMVAAGFGGTGMALAPAVGQVLAELATDGESRVIDLKNFAL